METIRSELMDQTKFRALGQALRERRMAGDLLQKEVIGRSGKEMAERTLRAYERGEQRPSRDRLLRLLIRSFELRHGDEINRYLLLAGYSPLTETEIVQQGLTTQTVPDGGHVRASAPGRPASFRIA